MNNILLVIDIQEEYSTQGRPFYINGIEKSLKNAKLTLEHARKNNWKIIHVKHIQEGKIFNKNDSFSNFIKDFLPLENERVFIKDNFSCFSNTNFTNYLEQYKNNPIYIIGYNSRMCVLSTIIEGYHLGYNLILVKDASNALADAERNEEEIHLTMVSVLSTFSDILSTSDIIAI